jgi:DNA-binding NarL/FixJ family response regulator
MSSILIIEDSLFIRYLLRQNLQELEMPIAGETGDPHLGISLFEQLAPAVTLIDYSLPQMSGREVAEAILQRNLYARLIMLFPSRKMAEAQSLIAMGVKAVISKPFHPEKLQSTLIEVVVGA